MCYGYGLMMGTIARIFSPTQRLYVYREEESHVFLILLPKVDALSRELNLLEIIVVANVC